MSKPFNGKITPQYAVLIGSWLRQTSHQLLYSTFIMPYFQWKAIIFLKSEVQLYKLEAQLKKKY